MQYYEIVVLACVCYSGASTVSALQNQVTAEAYFLSFYKSWQNRPETAFRDGPAQPNWALVV